MESLVSRDLRSLKFAHGPSRLTLHHPYAVMESMKTEVKLLARTAGKLSLQVKEGDTVGEGRTLCVVEPDTE